MIVKCYLKSEVSVWTWINSSAVTSSNLVNKISNINKADYICNLCVIYDLTQKHKSRGEQKKGEIKS